jgi:glycosyltransferase involved in cell wall biosynthesis
MSVSTALPSERSLHDPKRHLKLAIISSIIPKRCGIATFSRDLLAGIHEANNGVEVMAVAAETAEESFEYQLNVVARIHTDRRESYAEAASTLNRLRPDMVSLQHEFGLYGGAMASFIQNGSSHTAPTGDYILDLVSALEMPVITTLHTVLPSPDPSRREVIRRLGELSHSVVAMTEDSCKILARDYGIPKEKIAMIHHGVTVVPQIPTAEAKKHLGLDRSEPILMISGLIGANKSIDTLLRAMPAILEKHPSTKLYVLGQTHPNILAHSGEAYRDSLTALATELGVSSQLVFVNRYLSLPELLEYLQSADIYLTLHKDPEQAASGTLAYALGAGLAAVSTPYRYAKEMLHDDRGRIVGFDQVEELSATVNNILSDTTLYNSLRDNAYALGKQMSWPIVGADYLAIITRATTPVA